MKIQTRQLTREEFDEIKITNKHIRNHKHFAAYTQLDGAIAYKLGGSHWEDEDILMEAVIYNLKRLHDEKGPTPSDEDLVNYIQSHSWELRWNPNLLKEALSNVVKEGGTS